MLLLHVNHKKYCRQSFNLSLIFLECFMILHKYPKVPQRFWRLLQIGYIN